MKKSIVFILITGLVTLAFSNGVMGQDPDPAKSKKARVVLKISKDDKGNTTVVDTIFNLADPEGQKEFEEAMKQYELQIGKMEEKLKNMEVYVNIPDLPDSLMDDSVERHFMFSGKDLECPHFKWYCKPGEFSYDLDDCDKFIRGPGIRNFRFESNEQTLSDLLGEIPMSRVKSYTIKDRKNGKRIVIDLEDGPVIEKKDKVIIIRDPGGSRYRKNVSDKQMKVIIQSDDDKQD